MLCGTPTEETLGKVTSQEVNLYFFMQFNVIVYNIRFHFSKCVASQKMYLFLYKDNFYILIHFDFICSIVLYCI